MPKDKLEDPGRQLEEVLAFKSDVKGSERLFYREFTEANWRETLLTELGRYVVQVSPMGRSAVAGDESVSASRPVETAGKRSGAAEPGEEAEGRPAYPEEVRELIRLVHDELGKRWPQEATFDQTARLNLLAKAWFSEHHDTLLDVHELNIYYRARENLELSAPEWWLVVRSVVADEHGTMPGMFWIKGASDGAIADYLFTRAQADSEQVQVGALRLLAMADYPPPDGWLDAMVSDDSTDAKKALLAWVKRREPAWGVGVVRRLMGDSDFLVRSEAQDVQWLLWAAQDPDAALRKAAAQQIVTNEAALSRLRVHLSEISSEALRAALTAKNAETRSMAGSELARRRALTREEAVRLSEDDSSKVAEVGLRWLLWATDDPDDELLKACKEKASALLEERKLERFRAMSAEELQSRIAFYDVEALIAYRALALEHFDCARERLRTDLRDGFRSMREEGERKLVETFPAQLSDAAEGLRNELIARLRKADAFLVSEFTAAALAGMAEHGAVEDAVFARSVLEQEEPHPGLLREAANVLGRFGNREDAFRLLAWEEKAYGDARDAVRSAAVQILNRHATRADAERLVALAQKADGELQAAAARAAMKLAPGLGGATGRLLESGRPALVRLAFHALLGKGQGTRKRRATTLLSSENKAIRDAAVSFLANACDDKALRAVLDEYLEQPTYYYSVVCGLDRLLYAPGALGQAFQQDIRAIVREPKIEKTSRQPWSFFV